MSEKRFSGTEKNCYYTSLVFDNQTQEELGTSKVVGLLNEQQFTIEQLQKENKQLQKELNNCEKFRYTVFKRIKELW